jgi:predicted ATPase
MLAQALASVRHVHVVPQIAKHPMRMRSIAKEGDAAGSDFIDRIALLPAQEQRELLTRLRDFLKKAIPQFLELRVQRDDLGTPHLQARYRHWRSKGSWQDETDFSDGTLRLVGFCWALLDAGGPLLVEEPELSLHRDVARQIPRVIARASLFTERQVILTTNSEEILTDPGVDPSEVLILEPTPEETQVHLASDYEQISRAVSAGVSLGELITARTRPKGIEQLANLIPEGRP